MRKITYIKHAILAFVLILPLHVFSQTATPPSAGDGSESNPYQIASLENLYWLTQSDTVWDKHFIQTADIDAAESKNWDAQKGLSPIGNSTKSFTGKYNGKGQIIDSLYINRPLENEIGLFGKVSARIDSLGLSNVDINGGNKVGGFVGFLYNGQINKCYTKGNIHGTDEVGGFVGKNLRYIYNCYSEADVTGNNTVGGFVGLNDHFITWYSHNGEINKSYSICNVIGNNTVGGFAGKNEGIVTNIYSKGIVSGNKIIGGLIGYNDEVRYYSPDVKLGVVTRSYSTTEVVGNDVLGGLIGSNYISRGFISNCFWDKETSNQNTSDGGVGLTISEMKYIGSYLVANWDFIDETINGTEDLWGINSSDNAGYPFLHWQNYTSINLECEAPYSAPSNIVFGSIDGNSITLNSFDESGYITVGYAIYINSEDLWLDPEDGTEPVAEILWQNNSQQCIYFGTSNNPNITVTGLSELTEYYFKVYAYNVCDGTEMYETNGTVASEITDIETEIPDGEGSSDNPYIISNRANLAWLMRSDTVWNKYFIQTADIDVSTTVNWDNGNGFSPIGNLTSVFEGNYDGGEYIINHLYINRPTDSLIGLFGVTKNATVKNLGLTNVNIKGSKKLGGLAGYYEGGEITNCYTTGICVSNTSNDWRAIAGGLTGYNNGKITSCYSKVNVSSSYGLVGGLVGNNEGQITKSHSIGNVTGYSLTGGLAGYNEAKVSNCYSNSDVNSSGDVAGGFIGENAGPITDCHSTGNVTGFNLTGGLVGYNASSVSNCYSNSDVNCSGNMVGGLVGENQDIITCSYSNGNIVGYNYVGGLAGYNNGTVSISYSDATARANYDVVGGLVGINENYITSSYATGDVIGNEYAGGLVGVNTDVILGCYSRSRVIAGSSICGGLVGDNYGYTTSSFWDTETSGRNTSVGGEGLTTVEMQDVNAYINAGWDFMDESFNGPRDYWGINSNENEGYPFLYWQGYENTADITTVIRDYENLGILLYPNPVTETLNITFSENIDRMTITDITGRIIIDKSISTKTEQIDMTSFNAGIYFVNVYKANKIYTSKIIKR